MDKVICPQLTVNGHEIECPHKEPCQLLEGMKRVMCLEWVKKERRIGYKLAGEPIPDHLKATEPKYQ